MSRILKIKNFRNIGLEEEQKLIINYSLEKGKMGNVIYLLGANNSGKSNILDAFLIYHNNNLQKKGIRQICLDIIIKKLFQKFH